MTKDEYWQKFIKTGSVADYLAYTATNSYDTGRETISGEDFSNTYAGFGKCDGDDFEVGTYR